MQYTNRKVNGWKFFVFTLAFFWVSDITCPHSHFTNTYVSIWWWVNFTFIRWVTQTIHNTWLTISSIVCKSNTALVHSYDAGFSLSCCDKNYFLFCALVVVVVGRVVVEGVVVVLVLSAVTIFRRSATTLVAFAACWRRKATIFLGLSITKVSIINAVAKPCLNTWSVWGCVTVVVVVAEVGQRWSWPYLIFPLSLRLPGD